jgi:hypothetical protein
MKPTRIVELVIQDDNQELAIDAISLVHSPAIESDFVFFGKQKSNLTLAKVDEEKRMLISPALIPNKNIVRYDANTDSEYYVWFSKETVRKASELYLKHNNHHKATYEHQDRVSGVLTVESWIKEGDMDKSKLFGFNLPNGTWFVKMKIDNEELWQDIKSKKIKGLSIEGYFTNKFEQMQKKEFTTEEVRTALRELLSVQKVELALIDDINKPLDKAMSDFGNIEVGLFKAENTAVAAVGNYEKAAREAAKGVKMAKELGISSDIVKLFSSRLSEAEMGAKDASNIAKQIQKIISQL